MKAMRRNNLVHLASLYLILSTLPAEPVRACAVFVHPPPTAARQDGCESGPCEEILAFAGRARSLLLVEVESRYSYWSDDNSLILSDYIVRVVFTYVGTRLAETSFILVGGTVDDLRLEISTHPILEPGRHYLLAWSARSSGIEDLAPPTRIWAVDPTDPEDSLLLSWLGVL